MAGWAFPCGLVFDWAACEEFNRIVLGATLIEGIIQGKWWMLCLPWDNGAQLLLGLWGRDPSWAWDGDPCARGV